METQHKEDDEEWFKPIYDKLVAIEAYLVKDGWYLALNNRYLPEPGSNIIFIADRRCRPSVRKIRELKPDYKVKDKNLLVSMAYGKVKAIEHRSYGDRNYSSIALEKPHQHLQFGDVTLWRYLPAFPRIPKITLQDLGIGLPQYISKKDDDVSQGSL